jgi:D-aspartate ligase
MTNRTEMDQHNSVKSGQPLACVLGDMDLVRPLGLSGIECAVAVPPGAAPRFSRFTRVALEWANPWEHGGELVETLMRFGATQAEPPVLFYESDGELLLVSRHRERLRQSFRFVIADQTLVEDLVDKERFQKLAERLSLPVPAARRLRTDQELRPDDLGLRYPIIVKPLTRRPDVWKTVAASGKALRLNSPDELRQLWPRLAASGVTTLAQELIPGPETCIESYHVYVDEQDEIVGEFTGRKIRTYPREYGDSTALVTTNQTDVAELGRELVQRLRLRGVAKFDFKRGPDGRLYLLEVNPRFNLWHHLCAMAGVNLPALVYADLTGQPRTAPTVAQSEVRWCRIWQDALAARESHLSLARWLRWALGCEAQRLLSWDDPMPFAGAVMWRAREWQQAQFTKKKSQWFRKQVGAAPINERTTRPEMT